MSQLCAILVALVVLTTGCQTVQFSGYPVGEVELGRVIQGFEVSDYLIMAGIPVLWWELNLSDRQYSLIRTNWLLSVFVPGRKALPGYEARDCDKIVLESMVDMHHRNIRLKDPPAYYSLKVRWIDQVEGHEFNIAIGSDGEVYVVDETVGLVCNWKKYPQASRIKDIYPGRF